MGTKGGNLKNQLSNLNKEKKKSIGINLYIKTSKNLLKELKIYKEYVFWNMLKIYVYKTQKHILLQVHLHTMELLHRWFIATHFWVLHFHVAEGDSSLFIQGAQTFGEELEKKEKFKHHTVFDLREKHHALDFYILFTTWKFPHHKNLTSILSGLV